MRPFALVMIVLAVGWFGIMAFSQGSTLWRVFQDKKTVTVPVTPISGIAVGNGVASGGPQVFRSLEIISILGKDAIPAILDPDFISGEEAEQAMKLDDLVLGLSVNGDHRAYPISTMSSHEIVNDVVGGVPVAVTW